MRLFSTILINNPRNLSSYIILFEIVFFSMTFLVEGRKLFGGYKITPKFCTPAKELPKKDSNSHGPTICMFNHECTQRQGEVVGACMDR